MPQLLGTGFSLSVVEWSELAAQQAQLRGDEAITCESFLEDELLATLAMEDRNNCADAWPGRKIFVVLGDGNVCVFDEFGDQINEPSEGIKHGVQLLHSRDDVDAEPHENHGFADDWECGYYRLGVVGEGTAADVALDGAFGGARPSLPSLLSLLPLIARPSHACVTIRGCRSDRT